MKRRSLSRGRSPRVGLRVDRDPDGELADAPGQSHELDGMLELTGWEVEVRRGVTAEGEDVLDLGVPVAGDDVLELGAGVRGAGQVRHHGHGRVPIDVHDEVVRAITRRATRAVGHGHVRRVQWLELGERALELLLGLGGPWREELERDRPSAGENVADLGHHRPAVSRDGEAWASPRPAHPPTTGSCRGAAWTARMPPEKLQWKHLYEEVVTSGLCTGCAGCVIACPHDVLGYGDDSGMSQPFQTEDGFGPEDCSHGQKGCTSCTRACPRFRAWEPESTTSSSGGCTPPEEVAGISDDIVLARATDPVLAEVGQDGGLVSAILLYCLEHDVIDTTLVSYLEGDGSTWKAVPGVACTKDQIIASAGSRYTYSANTMAYTEAVESGL